MKINEKQQAKLDAVREQNEKFRSQLAEESQRHAAAKARLKAPLVKRVRDAQASGVPDSRIAKEALGYAASPALTAFLASVGETVKPTEI